MEISIGIITFGDDSIEDLIFDFFGQESKEITIKEMFIVTDKKFMNKILPLSKRIEKKKVMPLFEERRNGKFSAVNLFLEKATSEILILSSGDIRLGSCCLEKLCKPFSDKNIGMVSSHPKPYQKANNLLSYTTQVLWELHHLISLESPKFGELIALRNIRLQIPKTSVDEEMIAAILNNMGYKGEYASEAIIYNSGPKNIMDYISQRSRIYCGHLHLKKNKRYTPPTLNSFNLIKYLFKLRGVNYLWLVFAIVLEIVSRMIGYLKFIFGKENIIWEIVDK